MTNMTKINDVTWYETTSYVTTDDVNYLDVYNILSTENTVSYPLENLTTKTISSYDSKDSNLSYSNQQDE